MRENREEKLLLYLESLEDANEQLRVCRDVVGKLDLLT